MPELPEVETVRRQLAPRLEGRTLVVYRVSDPRWTAPREPNEVVGPLVGRRVEALGRRGKHLIAQFEDELFLLMHLRMTGTCSTTPSRPRPTRARSWASTTSTR